MRQTLAIASREPMTRVLISYGRVSANVIDNRPTTRVERLRNERLAALSYPLPAAEVLNHVLEMLEQTRSPRRIEPGQAPGVDDGLREVESLIVALDPIAEARTSLQIIRSMESPSPRVERAYDLEWLLYCRLEPRTTGPLTRRPKGRLRR